MVVEPVWSRLAGFYFYVFSLRKAYTGDSRDFFFSVFNVIQVFELHVLKGIVDQSFRPPQDGPP